MGDKTKIEWSDATWNPVTGCDRCSPGCDNCYALRVAARMKAMGQPNYQRDGDPRTSGPGFGVTCHPHMLDQPLRWKRPRRIFVNSMSDLFHPEVLRGPLVREFPFLAHVFAVMCASPQHTFQVLTKRPQTMQRVLTEPRFRLDVNALLLRMGHPVLPGGFGDLWPSNIWLGVSIESDQYAFRADHLRATPAAVRWISAEPLLGPLPSLDLTDIDWLIVGGESGPNARPMHPDWVRDLRDECLRSDVLVSTQDGTICPQRGEVLCTVPDKDHRHTFKRTGPKFFFKQWGKWRPINDSQGGTVGRWVDPWDGMPRALATTGSQLMTHVGGKKLAGRELDGRTWDEMPEVSR